MARGAALLDSARQGSHAGTSALSIGFTIGAAADRLLLVGVALPRGDVTVTGMSWRGMSGTRVLALSPPGRECRTELWRLLDPPSGSGQVSIGLSGSAPVGMGMVSYSGVDQRSPTGPMMTATGTGSPVRISITVPDLRPLLGLACLGGTWAMSSGPDAIAEQSDLNLWDFTEQNVVGLGNHQMLSGGTAAIGWNVIFANPFAWGAIGLSITPAIQAMPDAGNDAAPDLRPAEDLAADLAAPQPDLAADLPPPAPDADEADAVDEADAAPPVDAPQADASSAIEPDAGDTVRDVELEVGCACRLGAAEPPGLLSATALALLSVLLLRRRP